MFFVFYVSYFGFLFSLHYIDLRMQPQLYLSLKFVFVSLVDKTFSSFPNWLVFFCFSYKFHFVVAVVEE